MSQDSLSRLLVGNDEADQGYRRLLEALPLCVMVVDRQGVIRYLNASQDWAHGEVLGTTIESHLAEESRLPHLQALCAAFERGESTDHEVLDRDGKRWRQSVVPYPQQGTVNEALVFAQNIEGFRQAQGALKRAACAILGMAHAASWIDRKGRILQVNDAFCETLGYSAEALVGQHMSLVDDVVTMDSHDELWRIAQHQHSVVMESVYRRKDDTTFPVEITAQLVEVEGQQQAFVVVQDITATKNANELLLKLRAAVERVSDSVLITDVDGVIEYVNPAFQRTTGYSAREAIGKTPRIIKSGKHSEQDYADLWHTISCGRATRMTFTNKRKDGSFYQEERTISPIKDAKGTVVSFVGTGRDITQQLALEDKLEQAQKMEAVGRLAGSIAHDFNNVLTTIVSYATFLRDGLAPDDSRQHDISQVLRAADSASQLTNQLLAFSRRKPVEPRVIELNEGLVGITKMLSRWMGEGVELVLEPCPDKLPVLVDSGRLDQLVFNLAVNARDAMPQGGIVSIRLFAERTTGRDTLGPGDHAVLTVSDCGSGISPEHRERIFDPFFSTKGEQGTGLGLATCYSIVNQVAGEISVVSEPGKGSTFKVKLPIAAAEAATKTSKTPNFVSLAAHGTHVLVVEDQPAILVAVSRMLTVANLKVSQARTAEEALALANELACPPRVLITDVVLPGLSGTELAQRLRQKWPNLRVLLTSGFIGEGQSVVDWAVNSVAFLAKPFTAPALLQKLSEVLATPVQALTQPAGPDQTHRAALRQIDGENGSTKGRILVVDDNPGILQALERLFEDHETTALGGGEEAIQLLGAGAALDVVLCDVQMPQVSGFDVFDWISNNRAELCERVVFLSGGVIDHEMQQRLQKTGRPTVEKPFDVARLVQNVEAILARGDSS